MNDTAKIELSTLELELMNNSAWIITKHRVMEKISLLFTKQISFINKLFPNVIDGFEEIIAAKPKISKGERYQNLPYIILDYPAVFSKQDIFAIRTMFLWGNFLSVSIHLSGRYKKYYQKRIIEKIKTSSDNIYLAIGENQWQHHITTDSFLLISKMGGINLEEKIYNHPFIKISIMNKLEDVQQMEKNIKTAYIYLASLLK